MNSQIALKQYGDVKVNAAVVSASPHSLIQMLYDGLLERIAQMKGAMEQKNIELKGLKANQAISILSGLRESLNPDQDQALSERLDGIYEYVQRQLWKAHLHNNVEILNESSQLIHALSGAWREISPE